MVQNIVSHKTGNQNLDADGRFNVSISNVTTEESFETELGFSPRWSPVLKLKNKIIFGTNGHYIYEDYQEPQIAIKHDDSNDFSYLTFNDSEEELFPVYLKDDVAFIVGSSGQMYTINDQLETNTFSPFEELIQQESYFEEGINNYLMLDETNALYSVYNNSTTTFGILNFKEDNPSFTVLENEFVEDNNRYKILYQNLDEQEIFIVEYGDRLDHLIVLDRESYKVKKKFQIDQGYLMDFVVKLN
ncbi:hypothetical protein [Bacillus sp. Marseille-P3800]|uniref:hypothetical protein n=1 Tax=Bacillus sp. Marseille-P3800 TaxID=2014782 RepID=UPI00114594E7|nr:hypothetical protein [Bacillus sp. Marseille-P3800]